MENGDQMTGYGILQERKRKSSMIIKLNRMFARLLLVLIDICLSRGDDASRDLWLILTALRGPDADIPGLKARTTIYIRRAAFPRTKKRILAGQIYISADFDTEGMMFTLSNPAMYDHHFISHIREASDALHRFGREVG